MIYRPEIDGLRALAVVPVIFYHAGFSAFSGGYVGVDVFFVISGYLITSIIAEQIAQGTFRLSTFYERRARRILPVLLTVLLVSLPFAWAWLMPRDLESYAYSILAVLSFTSNIYFWSETGYFETAAELQPMLHTWSLAVEEQFYILFPLLLMVIWRRQPFVVLALVAVASLVLAEWALNQDGAAAFFLLPTRAWELLVGALAALYLRQATRPALSPRLADAMCLMGVALIVFSIVSFDESTRFPGVAALPPTLGTVLVILFARPGGSIHATLSLKPLVGVGLISYGAYLWHQPVFALFQHRFGSLVFDDLALFLIALSFGLAVLSYHIVEQPFRKRLALRHVVWSALSATGLAVGAAVLIYFQAKDTPLNVPSYRWAVNTASPELLRYVERRDVFMPCKTPGDDAGVQTCHFGRPNAPQHVVLWGDSLALALLSGLDEEARKRGLAGQAFVANGCPPILGLSNTHVVPCNGATHGNVLARILDLPDVTDVVITGNLSDAITASNVRIDGRASSLTAVRDNLSQAIEKLRAQGLHVTILEQGPVFPEDVSSYLLQNMRLGHVTPLSVPIDAFRSSLSDVRTLTDLPDIYVEADTVFCNDSTCPAVDEDGAIVIFDRNHVTRAYSIKLAQHLLDRMEQ